MSRPGIRAEWHLADHVDENDPFASVIYSAGISIDLNGSEEELAETVVRLLKREGRHGQQGLTCGLKDDGQDCRTCPQATLDPAEARSVLCRLGKDQAAVEERFNQRREARLAAVEELAEEIDAASELGSLSPELEELLTQVAL